MKRIWFVFGALLLTVVVNAQDFSYLKEIDLNNSEELLEAEEAAMECCCYLVAVGYYKKDVQRQHASVFIKQWVAQVFALEEIVCDTIHHITEGKEELKDIYLAYYAMHYLDSEKEADHLSLREDALLKVIEYCSNSSNKLKLTKALKQVKEYHEDGKLDQFFQDIALSAS